MAMLPPPPTKPITLPYQLGFSRGEKKMNKKNRGKEEKKWKSTLSHVLEVRGWVTGRLGLWLWLQLRNFSQWCCWFFKKNSSAYGTVYYLNRDNPVPNCPNSYSPPNAGTAPPNALSFAGTGIICSHNRGSSCTVIRGNWYYMYPHQWIFLHCHSQELVLYASTSVDLLALSFAFVFASTELNALVFAYGSASADMWILTSDPPLI